MLPKIPENKKLTNHLESIKKIKHLYLQTRIEIQRNTAKYSSMALVNNPENRISISKTEHPTKSTNLKQTTEMEELNSTPAKEITEETTAESFSNTFDKKNHNGASEALKEKVTSQVSKIQIGVKEEVDQRAKKLRDAVFSWR